MVYLEAARLTEVRAPEQTFQRLIAGVLSAWSGLVLLDFSDSSHLRQNFTPPLPKTFQRCLLIGSPLSLQFQQLIRKMSTKD